MAITPFSSTAITQLSPAGVPGRRYAFTAKEVASIFTGRILFTTVGMSQPTFATVSLQQPTMTDITLVF